MDCTVSWFLSNTLHLWSVPSRSAFDALMCENHPRTDKALLGDGNHYAASRLETIPFSYHLIVGARSCDPSVSSRHAFFPAKLLLSSCLPFVDPAALCGLAFALYLPTSDVLHVFNRSIWTTNMLNGCQIECSIKLLLISGQSERILGHDARYSVALTAIRVIPKLRAESNAYMGPGPAPANANKGTVEVHRGGMCHL
jgi:hypothetical protein